jgi:hypothetical protein
MIAAATEKWAPIVKVSGAKVELAAAREMNGRSWCAAVAERPFRKLVGGCGDSATVRGQIDYGSETAPFRLKSD